MVSQTFETLIVTPVLAAQWLQDCNFDEQRAVDRQRVTIYAGQMQQGRWSLGDSPIVFGQVKGLQSWKLVAGQHRLHAVVKSGCAVTFGVLRRVYDSHVEMTEDYASTNTGKNFTQQQQLTALGVPSLLGVSPKYASSAGSAIRLIGGSFTPPSRVSAPHIALSSPAALSSVLESWSAPIYAYYRATDFAPSRHREKFFRVPVLAIGIVTFRYQPEKALEFWKTACENEGLTRYQPERVLHEFLVETPSPDHGKYIDYALRVSRCWNAYCDNREIRFVRGEVAAPGNPDTKNGIFRLVGTPFAGKIIDALSICFGMGAK